MVPVVSILLFVLALDAADLSGTLEAVEKRYNRAATLTVEFEQKTLANNQVRRVESGRLSLRKPGRMRWDYTDPQGKLFLADGKSVYFYSPATNRVEKTPFKTSGDFRTPLAFLLGKLDFRKEFRDFELRTVEGAAVLIAFPQSDQLPYRKVEFTFSPGFTIERLLVTNQDQTATDLLFRNEKLNVPLQEQVFRFVLPPGAELIETEP